MQNRAYAFITIKAINDDDRIIEGIATSPSPDRVGDIVNPLGAKFKLPLPFLWQHQSDKPIGHVIEATPSAKGISFKAKIAKTDEPGPLKDLLDLAWQCIKMQLVAAVSIGFRPIKYAYLSEGGIDFEEWDWFELSAVTIPCQADATINSVKSIDAGLRKSAGVPDPDIIPAKPMGNAASGKSHRVVKLEQPVRDGTAPFVIRAIKRT